MKNENFLKEHNARHMWHPMAHPADSQQNAPTIVTQAEGVRITDVDGHTVIDAVGGLWNVNLGFPVSRLKMPLPDNLTRCPITQLFGAPAMTP